MSTLPMLGDDQIDHQHKYFLHIFDLYRDRYIQEPLAEKKIALFEDLLTDIRDFAQIHFSYEELYMKKKNYPDIAVHIAEHLEFIHLIQIRSAIERFMESSTSIRS